MKSNGSAGFMSMEDFLEGKQVSLPQPSKIKRGITPRLKTIEEKWEKFLEDCSVFNGKYRYKKEEWISVGKPPYKITLICSLHGEVTVTRANHQYNKIGCTKCKREEKNKRRRLGLPARGIPVTYTCPELVAKCKAKWLYKFKYDVRTIGTASKLFVTCVKHGSFTTTLRSHIGSDTGCCKGCKKDKREMERRKKVKRSFILDKTTGKVYKNFKVVSELFDIPYHTLRKAMAPNYKAKHKSTQELYKTLKERFCYD